MLAAVAILSEGLVSCPSPVRPSTTSLPVLYAVFSDGTTGFIAGYTIDESSGALTSMGAPVAAGTDTLFAGMARQGRFLYALNPVSQQVWEFYVNAQTGVPTPIPSSPLVLAAGSNPAWVQSDSSGFAYLTVQGTSQVSVYSIAPVTGALTLVTTSPALSFSQVVTVDPAGPFIYVSDNTGAIYCFSVDSSGNLTAAPGSPYATPGSDIGMAIDPSGSFLYAADSSTNDISAFSINHATGALSPLAGSPYVTFGTNPTFLVMDPHGKFLYAMANGSNTIDAFAINPSTGALSTVPGSPVAISGGTAATAPTIDPSGAFLYAGQSFAGPGYNTFHAYAIDQSTGALSELAGSPYTIAAAASITGLTSGLVTAPKP